MGFITQVDYRTRREVYSCEIGREGCDHTGCTAHKCPYGWCQRYYVCKSCWSKPEVKALFTKSGGHHEKCKECSEDYQKKEDRKKELLAKGKRLRKSALGHHVGGVYRIKVIFRDNSNTEYAYWMDKETYDAIPIGTPATVEDYEKYGTIVESNNTDIYSVE